MGDAPIVGAIVFGVIATLLLIILLSVSFQYVEYDQYGLKKDFTTSHVDYSAGVFDTGRYCWGPGFTTLSFQKLLQDVEFKGADALVVFTSTGINLTLEVSFQYQIQKAHVIDIFQSYGTDYEYQVANVGRASIKNAAVNFGVTDYFVNRSAVSNYMYEQLAISLNSVWADVPPHKFQLHSVLYPLSVSSQYLNSAITAQRTLTQLSQITADVYRAETLLLVSEINASASIVLTQAQAQAYEIQATASARAEGIRTSAEGFGVEYLCQALNITEMEDKLEFLMLYSAAQNSGNQALFSLATNNVLIRA